MSTSVITQTQIKTVESGIKQLRHSTLMKEHEFKDMFKALEEHLREVRLAHLTGTPKDRLQQGHQDVQFFYILVKMLSEVSSSHVNHQRENLHEVYSWFNENKHVLHIGPRFGKSKKEKKILGQRPRIKMGSTPRKNSEKENEEMNKENKLISEVPRSAQTKPSGVTFSESPRPQVPTPSKMVRSDSIEQLLPPKKTHPLTHLINPHSGGPGVPGMSPGMDTWRDIETPSDINSPVRFYPDSTGTTPRSDDGRPTAMIRHRNSQSSKWNNFQEDTNYGQDVLGRLQLMGRCGTPYGVRYAAHDQALMAENYTPDIISEYVSRQLNNQGVSTSILPQTPLEEFYELSEIYYPHKLPKYPSFNKNLNKPKSAPPGVRTSKPDKERSDSGVTSVPVKLDTLVNLIDTVTDEMVSFKEKLTPDPQPGFRQPTVGVEPPTTETRPKTAPVTISVPPARPSSPPGDTESAPPAAESAPVSDAVDWRGKVTPESSRAKWEETGFGGHTYIKKLPQTSMRSVGTTSGGKRPKTAPTTAKEKWKTEKPSDDNTRAPSAASHSTTEMDSELVNSMINVQHLGGTSKKKRRARFSLPGTKYYYEEGEEEEYYEPDLQYLSFITPKYIQGERAHSAPSGPEHHTTTPFDLSEFAAMTSIVIPGFDMDVSQHTSNTDSISASLERPDMTDFDEDYQQTDPLTQEYLDAENPDLTPEDDRVDKNTDNFNGSHENLTLEPADRVEDGETQASKEDNVTIDETTTYTSSITDDNDSGYKGSRKGKGHVRKEGVKNIGGYYSARDLISDINELVGGEGSECKDNEILNDKTDDDLQPQVTFKKDSNTGAYVVSGITLGKSSGKKGQIIKGGKRAYITRPRKKPLVKAEKVENIQTKNDEQQLKEENQLNIVKQIEELKTSPRTKSAGFTGRKTLQRPSTTPRVLKSQTFPPEELDTTMLKVQGQNQDGSQPGRRSVGRGPPRAQSATPLGMLRKQQEMLRRAPSTPYRTAPSIPGPHSLYGGRSPRVGQTFSTELEAHAVKDQSPRHYMQRVEGLRKSHSDYGMTPANHEDDEALLTSVLKVNKLGRRKNGLVTNTPPVTPEFVRQARRCNDETSFIRVHITGSPVSSESSGSKNLTRIGRPIAHYLEVNDPETYEEAVQKQREAKAAVDIQRLFRGYLVRSHYKYLKTEVREKAEDKQKAAMEIQRAFRAMKLRQKAIAERERNPELMEWARDYKCYLVERERERQVKAHHTTQQNTRNYVEADSKLSVIGPHVDIYQHFHPKKTGPDKAILKRAATAIQRWVRGHIIRQKVDVLRRKAKSHGTTYSRLVGQYKELVRRVQGRRGIDRPQAPFSFKDINDFMDIKKKYESVFEAKSFNGELEISELGEFFKDCDLFPAKLDIQEAMDLIYRGRPNKGRGLTKNQALELVFQIYPPNAAGMADVRKSTWMSPIINGEEAIKMMGTDGVENADYKTCFKLVAASVRHRKQRDREEADRKEDEERAERKKTQKKQNKGQSKGQQSKGQQGKGQHKLEAVSEEDENNPQNQTLPEENEQPQDGQT